MREPLNVGFGREYVQGWSAREAAWLIEASQATQAERMCAMPPREGERWVRLAELPVSGRIEQGLRDHQVLVLAFRTVSPAFCGVAPEAVKLVGVASDVEEVLEEAADFIEVQVVDASGKPRSSVRYVLQLPDGTETRGSTDTDGMLRHERLGQHGDSLLFLPDVETGEAA